MVTIILNSLMTLNISSFISYKEEVWQTGKKVFKKKTAKVVSFQSFIIYSSRACSPKSLLAVQNFHLILKFSSDTHQSVNN